MWLAEVELSHLMRQNKPCAGVSTLESVLFILSSSVFSYHRQPNSNRISVTLPHCNTVPDMVAKDRIIASFWCKICVESVLCNYPVLVLFYRVLVLFYSVESCQPEEFCCGLFS